MFKKSSPTRPQVCVDPCPGGGPAPPGRRRHPRVGPEVDKIGNALNEPRITLNTKLSKISCIRQILSTSRSKFVSILLYTSSHLRYRLVTTRQCIEWPQNDLKQLNAKSTVYTHYLLISETQILVRFALRLTLFEIQGYRKSEMHWSWMTPQWP